MSLPAFLSHLLFAACLLIISLAITRLMLTRVAREHTLPFNPLIPNEETVEAMKEARRERRWLLHSAPRNYMPIMIMGMPPMMPNSTSVNPIFWK